MSHQFKEPIAIIGSACRFAGAVSCPSELWKLLSQPRDVHREIPASRFSPDGFYHSNSAYHGHSNVKHGYFLDDDPGAFDAEFFGIRPAEAEAMDPQQRMLLEVVYEGLESAGLPIAKLKSSDTAVYVGLMSQDYGNLLLRDIQDVPKYYATGSARSILPNRVSYAFDWHGPSVSVDTACSSSLVAIHMALETLRAGDSRVALACGANLILGPESFIIESKVGMLSPEGRSYMWDQRANGYARGDGIAALVLKTLRAALEDGDHIECTIRETGLNQSGLTHGITMPSAAAQAILIKKTYAKAGLNVDNQRDRPQFFEAHGTGTPAGDPIEAQAIHSVFGAPGEEGAKTRAPLYVGSIKTVLGHTEGTAGIAGVLKACLALQNRLIPPNLLLEHLSDRVAPFYQGIEIPRVCQLWPNVSDGLRRASVNSFGFGGANAHAILESFEGTARENAVKQERPTFTPFVFSASSQSSLIEILRRYGTYLKGDNEDINIHDLAWTLRNRRSVLNWRSAIVASSIEDLQSQLCKSIELSEDSAFTKALPETRNRVLGIFTGQGAQYAGMGYELIQSSETAKDIIEKLDSYLKELPAGDAPDWSLSFELSRTGTDSRVYEAAISQPLCTAVQIMIVDLLRLGKVGFDAVVGHSSGEIAAAYAAGCLNARDAMIISYYRGVHLHRACSPAHPEIKGVMLAVGTSPDDAVELCNDKVFRGRIVVAAVNSSSSVTISGDEEAINGLEEILEDEGTFYRRLRVDKAYHSPHMLPCVDPYLASLRSCGIKPASAECRWFSSVYGRQIQLEDTQALTDVYWAENMTSMVLFSQAITTALTARPCDLVLEIGPHSALKAPASSTIHEAINQELPYHGTLMRGINPLQAMSSTFGFLWSHLGTPSVDIDGYERSMAGVCEDPHRLIKGLPKYPWKHETRYWHESRVSRKMRTRPETVHPLLGHPSVDSSRHYLNWKHFLHVAEIGWLSGHQVQSQVVFPAAGYVCIAIEAARHLALDVSLIELRNFTIHQAIAFDQGDKGVEISISLASISRYPGSSHDGHMKANFTISAAMAMQDTDDLTLVASCQVTVRLGEAVTSLLGARKASLPHMIDVEPERFYSALSELGYDFGARFQSLSSMCRKHSRSSCVVRDTKEEDGDDVDDSDKYLIHPTQLDASLQAIMLAHSYPGDGSLRTIHLPTTIRHVVVDPKACGVFSTQPKPSVVIDAAIAQNKRNEEGIDGNASIYFMTERTPSAAIRIQGAIFKPLSASIQGEERKVFSKVHWVLSQPDGHEAARNIDQAQGGYQDVTIELLERIAIFYLRQFDHDVPSNSPMRTQLPTSAYLNFARHVTAIVKSGRHKFARDMWHDDKLEDVLEASRPFAHCPDVQIMHLVGEAMPRVFEGEGTMLEYFRAGGNDILDRYYAGALGLRQSAEWIGRSAKQLVDRHRHMNILEIGAGTGSATKAIIKEIDQAFSSYTYTDISAAFFQNARSMFSSRHLDRMICKTLDVESDPVETQGYAEGTYDLVVCFFVLHATRDVGRCLRHIRRLLRPGGYLVVGEGQDSWEGTATMGFIFGTLPGWWVGADSGRVLSPYITPEEWDGMLRGAGFSGIDTCPPPGFQESNSACHFIAQAVDDDINFLREPLAPCSASSMPGSHIKKLVIIGGHTAQTSSLVYSVRQILATCQNTTFDSHIFPTLLDVDYSLIDSDTTVLSLTELDGPVFKEITPVRFSALKAMFQTGKVMLWVTSGRLGDEPYSHMTVGFGRVAANETPDLRLQQLDIADPKSVNPEAIAETLLRFCASISLEDEKRALWTLESEILLEANGQQRISRIEHVRELNDRYNSSHGVIRYLDFNALNTPVSLQYQPEDGTSVLKEVPQSITQSVCHSSSIELLTLHSTLSAIKTVGEFRFLVLGTHLATGKDYLSLVSNPVANVFTVARDCIVPLPLLPDGASKAQFLRILSSHLVATEVLHSLHPGQTIVAHNTRGMISEALNSGAKAKGINVIYTTDIAEETRIPDSWIRIPPYSVESDIVESIFPDQVSAFVGFSSQGTSSLDNEARLIEYLAERCQHFSQAKNLYSRTGSNTSNTSLVLETSMTKNLDTAVSLIRPEELTAQPGVGNLPTSEQPSLDQLLSISAQPDYPFDTVVDWISTSSLPIHVTRLDSKPMFKGKDSTYWIVGMSRALGISLSDWLISRGVMNLVITSRDPDIHSDWITAHKQKGVNVVIVPCDITDESQVQSAYRHICDCLPPIVGVIQGAMVLHDTLLRNMTFEKFRDVAGPKVNGSVHLDRLFSNPATDLDFFVLVSSINCVIGNIGQANYASANAFMCGLAAQRRKRGLRSAAVSIGAIIGAGYMARESRRELDNIVERYMMLRMSEEDWCQAISEAIDACRLDSPNGPELITGLAEVTIDDSHAPNAPNWCTDPTFSALVVSRETRVLNTEDKVSLTTIDHLRKCQTAQESYQVIEEAFADQLRVVLQISTSNNDLMTAPSAELGLDSLVSVDIRSWFLKYVQVNIPVLRIMSNDTMASLVLYALENLPDELLPGIKQSPNQLGGSETSSSSEQRSAAEELERIVSVAISPSPPEVTDVDIKEARRAEETSIPITNWELELESEIPAQISTVKPEMLPLSYGHTLPPIQVPPRIIVLTGSTGLLGQHILSYLLSQPTTAKVICLAVRQLSQRSLHTDPRVEYHTGDLTQPNLGLASASTLRDIFTQADAVIHNGADTSHLKPYGSVRAANVGSTKTLAILCVPRRIPLHYISSAGVGIFHVGSSTVGFPPGPVGANADSNLGTIADGSFGYGCSKLVCEVFLARMVAAYGLRVVIHRPSTIIREGDDAKGDGAERDWVNAFLTYVRKLGAVPEMPIVRARLGERQEERKRLDLVSVQTVCEGIARYLLDPYGSKERNSGGSEGEKGESEEEQRRENRLVTDDSPMNQERVAGVTYVHAVGDDNVALEALSDLGLREGRERYNVLPRAQWIAAALAAGIHPGVAVLIDGMAEGKEQYPLLIRGERTYWD